MEEGSQYNELIATFKAVTWKLSILVEFLKISDIASIEAYERMRSQQSIANDEIKAVLNDINEQLTKLIRSTDNDGYTPDTGTPGVFLT